MKSNQQILSALFTVGRGTRGLPSLLCEDCASALPVTGVGLALMTDAGHQGVVAATDGPARLLEELQFALGEGPCIDASRDHQPILLPDLVPTAVARWPRFGPAVLEAGIAAIFAFPLHVGAIRLGILDLYRGESGGLDDDQLADALAYADAAVVVLLHLQAQMTSGEGLHPQLAIPLEDRAQIHQASGVVAVQADVGLADALLLLRANAYAAKRPVLDVARDVLSQALRFHPRGSDDGAAERK